jgi:hypothetical protein
MALIRLNREPAAAPTAPSDDADAFPPWVISSVMVFLMPFVQRQGQAADPYYQGRDFLREVERNLRQPLNWRNGDDGAWRSLVARVADNPSLLVDIVDFALRNMLLGSYPSNCDALAAELNRALHEAGTGWRVALIEGTVNYRLERRTDPAALDAMTRITREQSREAAHLSAAWDAAYGRNPNPSRAYSEAIKAVEEVAIPVVLPNDTSATLGKVIGALRSTAAGWESSFIRDTKLPSGTLVTPIEVVIAMLDLLWVNQTDRHAPIEPISQSRAESAVHTALGLVGIFRSGSISKR